MCTVHSFPHNIDHCLTFARSEFEGMFEKAPAEANVYLADPEAYVDTVKKSSDAAARDQLEKVVAVLADERCTNFQDCLAWARNVFQASSLTTLFSAHILVILLASGDRHKCSKIPQLTPSVLSTHLPQIVYNLVPSQALQSADLTSTQVPECYCAITAKKRVSMPYHAQ